MLTIDQIQIGVIYHMEIDNEKYVLFRCHDVRTIDDGISSIYDDGYLKVDKNTGVLHAGIIDTETPAIDSDDLQSLSFATEEEIALYLTQFPNNTPTPYNPHLQPNNHYSIF